MKNDIEKFKDFMFNELHFITLNDMQSKKNIIHKEIRKNGKMYIISVLFVNDTFKSGALSTFSEPKIIWNENSLDSYLLELNNKLGELKLL